MSKVGFNPDVMDDLVSKIKSAGSIKENYDSQVVKPFEEFAEESNSSSLRTIAEQHKDNSANTIQALDNTINDLAKLLTDIAERVRREDTF